MRWDGVKKSPSSHDAQHVKTFEKDTLFAQTKREGWDWMDGIFALAKLLFKGDVFLVDYPTNRKIHSKNHWNMLRGGIFCR